MRVQHRLLGPKIEARRLFRADGIRGAEAVRRLAGGWPNRQLRPENLANGLKMATAPHRVLHHRAHRVGASRAARLRRPRPARLLGALERAPALRVKGLERQASVPEALASRTAVRHPGCSACR